MTDRTKLAEIFDRYPINTHDLEDLRVEQVEVIEQVFCGTDHGCDLLLKLIHAAFVSPELRNDPEALSILEDVADYINDLVAG